MPKTASSALRSRTQKPSQERELSPAPTLSVEEIHYTREGNRILKGVSWCVNPGEHWVILGANGSGKTSLLKILIGFEPATRGAVSVMGQRHGRSNWVNLRRSIGIVSSSIAQQMPEEEEALVTVLSGKYAMIEYWGRFKKQDIEEAKEVLKRIGSEELAYRPWRALSQGERQRILIGRALMAKPKLLILDEPCSGLDPVAREHFLTFLQQFATQKEAPALLFVTHHVEEIIPAFSHALILREGEVVAAGPKESALSSENLTRAFGEPIELEQEEGRYTLRLRSSGKAKRVFKK